MTTRTLIPVILLGFILGSCSQSTETITASDVQSARAYLSKFKAGPEGPALPEGTRSNQLLGGCIESLGVEVAYAGAGGVFRPPGESNPARGSALSELCLDTMAAQGLVSVSDTDPQIMERRYRAYLEAYGCLSDLGIHVRPPPSLEEFLNGEAWSPFDGVPTRVNSDKGVLEGPPVRCAVP